MKHIGGWWLPESEKHLGPILASAPLVDMRGTYQMRTWAAVLQLFPAMGQRRGIDIGAHVGLWSYHLAKCFARVDAFEPVLEFRRCFERNVKAPNAILHSYAIGAASGPIELQMDPDNSGASKIIGQQDPGDGVARLMVEMRTLDGYGFEDVDFIKIDVEGFEPHVIAGARETLERCKPVMVIEQKGGFKNYGFDDQYKAVKDLEAMGAKVKARIVDDFILSW